MSWRSQHAGCHVHAGRKSALGTVHTDAKNFRINLLTNSSTHAKYALSPPLGDGGGFSKFRVAANPRGEVFAVKEVYLPDAPKSLRGRQKLDTCLAALRHEQIMLRKTRSRLAFRDIISERGRVYCVMERMHGDLFEALDSSLWSIEAGHGIALHVLITIGQQLAAAQKRGVVHNDVKPENILWNANGDLLLGDLGAARDVRRDRQMSTTTVTAQYAAPERLANRPSGAPADMWSLGMVALVLICRASTPLYLDNDDAGDDAESMRRRLKQHARWHRRPDREPKAEAFAAGFRTSHGALADFLLKRVLHPDPRQRATAAEVVTFARGLQTAEHINSARNYFDAMAKNPADTRVQLAVDTVKAVAMRGFSV